MVEIYFKNFMDGRLARLQYLGYSLLLTAIAFGIIIVLVFAMGAGEHLLGGDLTQAQDKLRGWFALPTVVLFSLGYLVLIVAGANIMAKRIRDMGLPGWWVVVAISLLVGGSTTASSEQAGGGLMTIIWIALLLIPSGAFTNRE